MRVELRPACRAASGAPPDPHLRCGGRTPSPHRRAARPYASVTFASSRCGCRSSRAVEPGPFLRGRAGSRIEQRQCGAGSRQARALAPALDGRCERFVAPPTGQHVSDAHQGFGLQVPCEVDERARPVGHRQPVEVVPLVLVDGHPVDLQPLPLRPGRLPVASQVDRCRQGRAAPRLPTSKRGAPRPSPQLTLSRIGASGGIGRRNGFRGRRLRAWGFESPLAHSCRAQPRRRRTRLLRAARSASTATPSATPGTQSDVPLTAAAGSASTSVSGTAAP